MKRRRTEILTSHSSTELSRQVTTKLDELEEKSHTVEHVMYSAFYRLSTTEYTCMIIWKEKIKKFANREQLM
jgi:hypothetical protein